MAAPGATDQLVQLRHKYDPVIRLMHAKGVRVKAVEMQGDKLLIKGEAPSAEVKNQVWDEIKRVDSSFRDLVADIAVAADGAPAGGGAAAGPAAAGAGQGGPGGTASAPARSYTVQKGDTLSKIAQQQYGKASEYKRIFEANRDQLQDPDHIRPGQVLRIPEQ